MSRSHWGRYEDNEVQALIDHYLELRYMKHRPAIHVRLIDLERAISALPRKLFEVMLLAGLLRFTNEAAGRHLGVSESAVRKRYRQGFDFVMDYLNGEVF